MTIRDSRNLMPTHGCLHLIAGQNPDGLHEHDEEESVRGHRADRFGAVELIAALEALPVDQRLLGRFPFLEKELVT